MSARTPASRPALVAALALAAIPAAGAEDRCGGLSLTDVAVESGLRFVHDTGATGAKHLPETMGAGAAWLDYDGDGLLDLYVVQSGAFPPDGGARSANRLYRNLGGGRFSDVTEAARAGDRGYGQGVVAADADGDGRDDLYVCNYGRDTLLRNKGDGSFEDATERAGLGLDGWSSSAAFADADADGDLDLYVTRYLEFDVEAGLFCGDLETGRRRFCDPSLFAGAADRFYINTGDGRFEDRTVPAGFGEANGKGLGVLFTDLDDDLRPDIYVANDLTINLLYRNAGGGRFEPASLLSGAGVNKDGKAEAGMGLALGDVDGDLDPDLMVTNFDVETNTVYENLGAMQFEDNSVRSGFGRPSFNLLGFGIVLGDFDRDGNLDAYVANGHIFEEPRRESVRHAQPDLLMLGDGGGRFRDARCGPAMATENVGRGLAAADYDNDGDLDLALVNNGGPLQLLRNDGVSGGWVGVALTGRPPNTGAIGARVRLSTAATSQVRWVTAGDSYQSSSDRRLLFGLGDGGPPAELEVRWPSGRTRSVARPSPGRYLALGEDGDGDGAPAAGATAPPAPGPPGSRSPAAAVGLVVLLAVLIGAAGWWAIGRRHPG